MSNTMLSPLDASRLVLWPMSCLVILTTVIDTAALAAPGLGWLLADCAYVSTGSASTGSAITGSASTGSAASSLIACNNASTYRFVIMPVCLLVLLAAIIHRSTLVALGLGRSLAHLARMRTVFHVDGEESVVCTNAIRIQLAALIGTLLQKLHCELFRIPVHLGGRAKVVLRIRSLRSPQRLARALVPDQNAVSYPDTFVAKAHELEARMEGRIYGDALAQPDLVDVRFSDLDGVGCNLLTGVKAEDLKSFGIFKRKHALRDAC